MFIKFFVGAVDENEAKKIVEDSLEEIEEIINKKIFKSLTSYWKMKDTYVVEMKIKLFPKALNNFLEFYSDKWLELGCPVNELVASKNSQESVYMKQGFILINIFCKKLMKKRTRKILTSYIAELK